MLSQQEVYQVALRTISTRRQVARTLADENLATLEAAFPNLAAANKALQRAGIAASLAAAKGEDTAAAKVALADAKKQQNAALAEIGRAPSALLPQFICEVCQDTGMHNGNVCHCVQKLMRTLRREEIAKTTSLSITQFDELNLEYYPAKLDPATGETIRQHMAALLGDLKDYAQEFDHDSCNLFLCGNSGLGKTHAALAIAGIVLEKGYDVIYLSCPEFFSKLELYHFNDSPAEERVLLEAVNNADLLILDDLGTELVSAFTISTLYTLLNNRTAARLPTIFTSNIRDNAVLEKRYTEKISSRIYSACEEFNFLGDDIRAIKSDEV